jgi:hypothetical protein
VKTASFKLRCAGAILSASSIFGLGLASHATELPPYMDVMVGDARSTSGETATENILALNTGMFELYNGAAKTFERNLLAQHPIILALFSGVGGRFILYRPGLTPLEAPPVPVVYQLLKSVDHSTMALAEVAGPHLNNRDDQSWRGPMLAYRSKMQSALDGLDATGMQEDWRANNRSILQNNITFMDECVTNGTISFAALQSFSQKQAPYLKKNIAWAAQTQVAHWMEVMTDWKTLLGSAWDKTYAASNSIYVARQNNILFSVLAQFFGPDAINSRLILIETMSFTTTPDELLESLTRIISDRSVGALFFGNYYLMDYELMGGDGRTAIIAESSKRGMTPFLPPLVPFGSHQWPGLITPGSGPGSFAELP